MKNSLGSKPATTIWSISSKTRVETSENFGSKDQDSMAAYMSMIQALEEGDLWMTENITRRFNTGGQVWENNPFFQTPFTHDEVTQFLIPLQ